jgi:hypothetical protein
VTTLCNAAPGNENATDGGTVDHLARSGMFFPGHT